MSVTDVFVFQVKGTETLEENMQRACEVIISTGLGIRGGEIAPGGNNVAATNAAKAIAARQDLMERAGSYVSGPFFEMKNMIEARLADDLEKIAECAIALKSLANEGRIPQLNAQPVNWDVNGAGAKRATYREPVGIAKQLVKSFGMDAHKPKTPTLTA